MTWKLIGESHEGEEGRKEVLAALQNIKRNYDAAMKAGYGTDMYSRFGDRAERAARLFRELYLDVFGVPCKIDPYGQNDQAVKDVMTRKPVDKSRRDPDIGFSDDEIQSFLDSSDCPYDWSYDDVVQGLKGELPEGLKYDLEYKLPVKNHPVRNELIKRKHPVLQAIAYRNNL